MAYASRQLELMEVQEDGTTVRDQIDSHLKQTGEYPAGWEPRVCPYELFYLWEHWLSMNGRRTSNGFGPNPISEEGVVAYQVRRALVFDPLENAIIDALEQMYFEYNASKRKK